MKKQVLFIQGGGNGGYKADAKLVDSLKGALGDGYEVSYPQLQDESDSSFGWPRQIGEEVSKIKGDLILVAHSLGASMVLKYLSEMQVPGKIKAVFLLAPPHWTGDEDWKEGLKLQNDFAKKLPENIPIFLYQCRDDEEVPFDHHTWYVQQLPKATAHEIKKGGHQFNNDLLFLANDIKGLKS